MKQLQPLTPAALYARVSSDRQDVDLAVSGQLRALKDYARATGYCVPREYVDDAGTVEEVFAQARDAEATAEEHPVDDGWKPVEVELEAVAVNGNGHRADGIVPTVELVLGNDNTPNGNGHLDEALSRRGRCSPGRSCSSRSSWGSCRNGCRSPLHYPCSSGHPA